MSDAEIRNRNRAELLAAFARDGITYPPARLEAAVSDYTDLRSKLDLMRAACPAEAEPATIFAPLETARHD